MMDSPLPSIEEEQQQEEQQLQEAIPTAAAAAAAAPPVVDMAVRVPTLAEFPAYVKATLAIKTKINTMNKIVKGHRRRHAALTDAMSQALIAVRKERVRTPSHCVNLFMSSRVKRAKLTKKTTDATLRANFASDLNDELRERLLVTLFENGEKIEKATVKITRNQKKPRDRDAGEVMVVDLPSDAAVDELVQVDTEVADAAEDAAVSGSAEDEANTPP